MTSVVADPFAVTEPEFQPDEEPSIVVSTPTTGAVSMPVIPSAPAPVPRFEGAAVAKAETRLTGTYVMKGEESMVVGIDDRVRIIAEYRVVGVRFEPNNNGDLVRVQILKPIEADRCPYDPSDPTDDGVWRSRPAP